MASSPGGRNALTMLKILFLGIHLVSQPPIQTAQQRRYTEYKEESKQLAKRSCEALVRSCARANVFRRRGNELYSKARLSDMCQKSSAHKQCWFSFWFLSKPPPQNEHCNVTHKLSLQTKSQQLGNFQHHKPNRDLTFRVLQPAEFPISHKHLTFRGFELEPMLFGGPGQKARGLLAHVGD